MHLASACWSLLVGENPHVGGDACIVEDVVGKLYDGIYKVVLHHITAYVALAATRIAREEAGTVVDGSYTRALGLLVEGLHLIHFLKHEQELAVAGAGCAIHDLAVTSKVGDGQFETVVE